MRLLPIASLLLLGCAASSEPIQLTAAEERALQGEVLGEPISCVALNRIDDIDYVGEQTVIFRMKGGPDYRNDLPQSCPFLRDYRAITYRTVTNRLCSIETFNVVDPAVGTFYGSCQLGEFIPYRVPEDAQL